ncbi:MAG: family 43 glycosylhydrolase, partial [Micromonosporaceae bacterium]
MVVRRSGVWAPDAWQTPAGWVLYYSAPARGMGGQRCIGVATADSVMGPYTPNDTPLVCPNPALGADDPVPGQPVANAGVIDPSPFRAADGRRYLLYRTQMTPSTLRMVPLESNGLNAVANSRELRRNSGIIENPVMVQRGNSYVLF